MVAVQAGQNAEALNWLEKVFAGQNAGTVLMDRPHKKSVKKILCRALINEIDVTEVWTCPYSVSPSNA